MSGLLSDSIMSNSLWLNIDQLARVIRTDSILKIGNQCKTNLNSVIITNLTCMLYGHVIGNILYYNPITLYLINFDLN